MSMLGLKEPLLQAEKARQGMTASAAEGGLRSKVRNMVSSVWSKVTRPTAKVGLVKDL